MTARTANLALLSAAAAIVALVWMNQRKRNDDKSKKADDSQSTKDRLSIDIESLPGHLQRELHKEQRRKEKVPFLAMKSPMYDNIQMLDPQGRVLSTISSKKAKWYVNRQLAEWQGTTKVQLLFEPKGRDSDNIYTITPKRNICVACAAEEHHMRHYIVPYAYRSLLPPRYKSHLSHDVVVLCPACHLYCSQAYQLRMKELEEELRHDPSTATPNVVDSHLYNVRSAALALLRWKAKLPDDKVEAYDKLIRQHLGITDNNNNDPLSDEQLQQAIDVPYRIPNPTYISGAELVANSLVEDDSDSHRRIEVFVREWRSFFLDIAQPQYLPAGWNVEAPVACSDHKV